MGARKKILDQVKSVFSPFLSVLSPLGSPDTLGDKGEQKNKPTKYSPQSLLYNKALIALKGVRRPQRDKEAIVVMIIKYLFMSDSI
jgi:hypothetical protein